MSADKLVATRICDARTPVDDNEWYCTLDHGHDGPHEAHGIGGSLWHTWPRAEPQTWALPAEPGPEVTAVRDVDGNHWAHRSWPFHQDGSLAERGTSWVWVSTDGERCRWQTLVLRGPLTNATDASHPTAAAPAGAEPPPTGATHHAVPEGRGGADSPTSASPP